MPSKNKMTIIAFLIAAVVGVTFITWTLVSNRRTARRYQLAYSQIKLGASKDIVLNFMGEPSRVTDCVHPWFPDKEREAAYKATCKELYVYEAFPADYTISFDKDGKVINKTTAVSP